MLATTDRLIVAHLEQLVAKLEAQSFARFKGTTCRPQKDVTDHIFSLGCKNKESTEELVRQTLEEQAAQGRLRIGEFLNSAAAWVGSLTSDTTSALESIDSFIRAQQLLLAAQGSYIMIYATLSTAPGMSKPLASTLSQILTRALFEGKPVNSMTKKAAVGSTGQRNSGCQCISWRGVAQRLAWA